MFTRRPNILWLLARRLDLIPSYLKGRAARLCRDLYTDFHEKAHFVKPTWRPQRRCASVTRAMLPSAVNTL
jgi:hypothetical protein